MFDIIAYLIVIIVMGFVAAIILPGLIILGTIILTPVFLIIQALMPSE